MCSNNRLAVHVLANVKGVRERDLFVYAFRVYHKADPHPQSTTLIFDYYLQTGHLPEYVKLYLIKELQQMDGCDVLQGLIRGLGDNAKEST